MEKFISTQGWFLPMGDKKLKEFNLNAQELFMYLSKDLFLGFIARICCDVFSIRKIIENVFRALEGLTETSNLKKIGMLLAMGLNYGEALVASTSYSDCNEYEKLLPTSRN